MNTEDKILLLDLIRHLVQLAEGGVYNDIDVVVMKLINSWIPSEFKDKAGDVLILPKLAFSGNREDNAEGLALHYFGSSWKHKVIILIDPAEEDKLAGEM